jgi:hypothetical protein
MRHSLCWMAGIALASVVTTAQGGRIVDIAQLSLEVTKTETAPELAGFAQGRPFAIRAGAGEKLVIVTLEGNVPQNADSLAFGIDDFSTMRQIGNDLVIPIKATAIRYGAWNSREHGFVAGGVKVQNRPRATFDVAFVLPTDTASVAVRYPTIAPPGDNVVK